MWCIGKITSQYRKRMYHILDLYAKPYNPRKPLVGLDEKPKQLVAGSRKPIKMKPGKAEKYDYEYVRNGSANIFVAVEPKAGRHTTEVTDRRTKPDFAKFVKRLVDKVYTDAERIQVVVDNLNTHSKDSFYETFGKEEAKRILRKVKFHYTPKHASWLNVAEIEISAMDTECTDRRIKDKPTLIKEVRAWTNRRNKHKEKIEWKFTKYRADKKLSKHYVT